MNEIELPLPEFLSSGDEDSFFAWLERIPAFRSSRGLGEILIVELADVADDDDSLRELIALFMRHDMDASALRNFESDQNREWFKENTRAYWHKSVFGSGKQQTLKRHVAEKAIKFDGKFSPAKIFSRAKKIAVETPAAKKRRKV